MTTALPFDKADKKWKLTRLGEFDAGFDEALVLEGDLHLGKKATGADVLKAFGLTKGPDASTAFVVTGDLIVDGSLDLDDGIHFSMGLVVLGSLKAEVVRLDMTMLFVFKGATVNQAIFFETNDGTLSIAGKTKCPVVIIHEGDANLSVTGEVFNSYEEGPLEDEGDDDDEDDGDEEDGDEFPFARVTMTRAEASKKLVASLFKDDEFNSDAAFTLAQKGTSLFRAKKK